MIGALGSPEVLKAGTERLAGLLVIGTAVVVAAIGFGAFRGAQGGGERSTVIPHACALAVLAPLRGASHLLIGGFGATGLDIGYGGSEASRSGSENSEDCRGAHVDGRLRLVTWVGG